MVDWVPLGERAIRIARPSGVSARALVQVVRAWPGVVDVVVARHDLGVYFDGAPAVPDKPFAGTREDAREAPRTHLLRAVYDGADLAEVARATGLARDEVVHRHVVATYTVDAIGFQPGFAYLVGLDPILAVPRRASPRLRVPARAIGIASDATCVYPFESPGGWNLIGHVVDAELFGARGALLQLGDRVRFEPC